MTKYSKKFKYLQLISKVKLKAAQRAKLEREVYYPPERIKVEGEINTTINGETHVVSLIYKGRAHRFLGKQIIRRRYAT